MNNIAPFYRILADLIVNLKAKNNGKEVILWLNCKKNGKVNGKANGKVSSKISHFLFVLNSVSMLYKIALFSLFPSLISLPKKAIKRVSMRFTTKLKYFSYSVTV